MAAALTYQRDRARERSGPCCWRTCAAGAAAHRAHGDHGRQAAPREAAATRSGQRCSAPTLTRTTSLSQPTRSCRSARWRAQSAPNTRWPSERAAADPGQERAWCSCLPLRQLRRAAGRACGSPGGAGLRRRKRTPLRPRPPDAGHSPKCASAMSVRLLGLPPGGWRKRLAVRGWSRAVTTTASRTASGRPARERGTPKHV